MKHMLSSGDTVLYCHLGERYTWYFVGIGECWPIVEQDKEEKRLFRWWDRGIRWWDRCGKDNVIPKEYISRGIDRYLYVELEDMLLEEDDFII